MLVLLPMIGESYHTRFYHSEGRVAGENVLSLLVSQKSFQFAVFDKDRRSLRELCHVDLPPENSHDALTQDAGQLEFLLHNYRLTNTRFEKVYTAVLHPDFAMMPAAFAGDPVPKSVLAFGGTATGPSAGSSHHLNDMDFCFSTSLPVQQALERAFSNGMIRHAGAVAISLFTGQQELSANNVLLNIHQGMIELLARKGRQLLFYNVFNVETNEDILYYLLFMAEQFGLPPKEISIGVGGQADDELLSLLRKFTGRLQLAGQHGSVPLTGKFAGVQACNYFTLLNQHLCEL